MWWALSERWKDCRAKERTRYKTMALDVQEFMRRFLLHVLLHGFHRIRHYELTINAGRKKNLVKVENCYIQQRSCRHGKWPT